MPPRSRFITVLSLTSIFLQGYLIIQGISNLMFMLSLRERPEYRLAEQMLPEMTVSPARTAVELLLYAVGIAASVAMFNRLNWGRVMFMGVLCTATVWETISGISAYLSMSEYLRLLGMGSSLPLLLFGSTIAFGVNGWIVWKLSREEVRNEFFPVQHPVPEGTGRNDRNG
jgi:hypothetical protein